MPIPGGDAVGRQAVGQITNATPDQPVRFVGGGSESPRHKAGLATAVLITTLSGFVAPPRAQAGLEFFSFQQPEKKQPVRAEASSFEFAPGQAIAVFNPVDQSRPQHHAIPEWRNEQAGFVAFQSSVPFTGFFDFQRRPSLRSVATVEQTSWNFDQPDLIAPPDGGGTSRKLIDNNGNRIKGKTGFEPVRKRPPEPPITAPSRPKVWTPPQNYGRIPEPARPAPELVDPILVPSNLLATMEAMQRAEETSRQMQDEQDAADIADILGLLDD